ncbi:chondroitinase-B domain-containing protein [Mucisphaera calidilacus]|uniref:Probable pectate lyase C n=1 Tax=Mucisphaera calidilacus TaxID=2527982 RepID=A0A518BUT2_9BACT|nr:chondroitinase-B domain-containing protein [Mucisphaera calidilacus]QDU70745.1 Chondroitinase-B precursor [Mucisphaera calidilacus]
MTRWLVRTSCICVMVSVASAETFFVSSAAQIEDAMDNAAPGDTLVMTDGVWNNQSIDFAGHGTADNPITLRAQSAGGVILTGSSNLSISGSHLVVDGLTFNEGRPSGSHIIRFTGSQGDANHSRLTNTTITNYNPADINDRYFWVSLYGQDNRVDHSRFQGQNHSGVTLVAWLDGDEARHRIDHNHFADRPEGNGNGFETIRIGTSEFGDSSAKVIVENNLFERVDGEVEIISNKSNDNIYRYNTFAESKGTLTLRHGHRANVEGNFFLGKNKDGSGGVRVIGEDHQIINNYFADLDDRMDGVISITAGIENTQPSGYQQVKNALIAHNTIIDAEMPGITFDWGLGERDRTLLAEDVIITGNLILSYADTLFEGNEGPGWTWSDNLVWGAPTGITARPGVTVADTLLQLAPDGLWRPAANSPAIDAIAQANLVTPIDMDGQPRIGLIDIGADEVADAAIVRKPLTSNDVGPDWDNYEPIDPGGPGDPTDPPAGAHIAIEAEQFASVIDPNSDGDTWTVVAAHDAFGGLAIEAPQGDRYNSGSGAHDAIVTYDLTFDEAGNYTAYYRARGFSGSTDSFYHPDALDQDPDQNETTSSNGGWLWETGETFTITDSHLDVPLELRLGKREQTTQIDAIILHINNGLTPGELDALMTRIYEPLSGDFNSDGVLDAADLELVQIAIGTTDTTYDLDDNGIVDAADTHAWLIDAYGTILGDINLDRVVDLLDLSILAANFQTTGLALYTLGDITVDQTVNLLDLSIFASNFGSAATIPSPSTGFFLLCTGLLRR